uniref:F-box domain-containing protein n=2 Tax=Quercus lobata TaxID=97700 RepID=A0A7N2R2N3_QUELO
MSDYLPDEVVLKILHRLPVKSLIRFRCVSKSWNSLITTPSFINSHLSYNSSNSDKLIVRHGVGKPYLEHYKLIEDNNDSSSVQIQHIDFPLASSRFRLIGSVNGLLCLCELERYVLWNPSIRKFITLPNPCITVKSHGEIDHRSAFGFDPRTNDYKVVRIVFQDGTKTSEAAKIPVVEIYSLNEGSWRITSAGNSFSPGFMFNDAGQPSASLNGAVHFVGIDRDDNFCPLVLSFDLGDEVFRIIPVPNGAFRPTGYVLTSVIGGSLSLLCHDSLKDTKQCCSIWVMKEYGVVDSWTKQLTFDFEEGVLLGLQKNGNILVETELPVLIHCEISSYDPKSKQSKNLGIFGRPFSFCVENYMENLVLLDKPNDSFQRRVSRKRKYRVVRDVKCNFVVVVDDELKHLQAVNGNSCTRTNGLLLHFGFACFMYNQGKENQFEGYFLFI